jgi:hypothetical protein
MRRVPTAPAWAWPLSGKRPNECAVRQASNRAPAKAAHSGSSSHSLHARFTDHSKLANVRFQTVLIEGGSEAILCLDRSGQYADRELFPRTGHGASRPEAKWGIDYPSSADDGIGPSAVLLGVKYEEARRTLCKMHRSCPGHAIYKVTPLGLSDDFDGVATAEDFPPRPQVDAATSLQGPIGPWAMAVAVGD